MEKISLALDWTPNINHIGFFVAKEKGFYGIEGLDVQISNPSFDNYTLTPAKKVELGIADFALCPTESILSYQTKSTPFKLIAVAAILQNDLSAIAVLKESGIDAPKDLDGKTYASYEARYEDEIVRQMIKNDGGQGAIKLHYPPKLGIWETLIKSKFDATWIFMNWEGVQAEQNRIELNHFKMEDFGIPYSYSPVLAADQVNLRNREDSYQKFLKASKRGFLHCQSHPEEAIQILQPHLTTNDRKIDLEKCLQLTNPHFGSSSQWGLIDPKKIENFLSWIFEHQLESKKIWSSDLFTNELLDKI